MRSHSNNHDTLESRAVANEPDTFQANEHIGFVDNRKESIAQRKLIEKVQNSLIQIGLPSNQTLVQQHKNHSSKSDYSKGSLNQMLQPSTERTESGTVTQLMWMYRVQDDDTEKKRVMIDDSGNVKIGPGPLNVSAGYPDHAIYFLSQNNPYETDVVEFELDDDIYYHLVENMVQQKNSKGTEKPSFNDISKPGFKIEIPNGEFLELFAKGVVQGTGKVTRGGEFLLKEAPTMYNEKEVCDMAKAIIETFPDKITKRQVIKVMVKDNGLTYSGGSFSNPDGMNVNWQRVNDELWPIFNKMVNREL